MDKVYKDSGIIDWSKTIRWFIVGLVCSGTIGGVYGFLTYYTIGNGNKLDIPLFIATAFVLAFLMKKVAVHSHARNSYVVMGTTIASCLFAWYCNWCAFLSHKSGVDFLSLLLNIPETFHHFMHYMNNVDMLVILPREREFTQIGIIMPAFYILELSAFLFPVVKVGRMKTFFCERCKRSMIVKTAYSSDIDIVNSNMDNLKKGDAFFLKFIHLTLSFKDLNLVYKAYRFNFNLCTSCQSVVLYVERISIIRNPQGKFYIADSEEIVSGVFLDKNSSDFVIKMVGLNKFYSKS